MAGKGAPGAFRLQAVSDVALISSLRDAVVKQIARTASRREEEAGIAAEARHLVVERTHGMQIAQDAVMGDLALAFVQPFRWKARGAVGIQHEIAAVRVMRPQSDDAIQAGGLKPPPIGNLEDGVGGTQHGADAAVLVQYVLQEGKTVILIAPVMQDILDQNSSVSAVLGT